MQILQNVLSEETISAVITQVNTSISQNKWSVSTFWWSKDIRIGNHVGVVTQIAKDDVIALIDQDIRPLLPAYDKLEVQYYLWPEGSNISWHDDGDGQKKLGATIYLNQEWHPDYGGLFIWEERDTKELKVLCPSYNTMVVNDKAEMHLVTPVTSAAPLARLSLQIWGFAE
jgi:Rps23 Pro-64 3,4-dihydroxylase Tpa1-like proline 4-hydroxylase